MYRCSSCGSIVDGQRFCANCGTPNANFGSQLAEHSQVNMPKKDPGPPHSYGQMPSYGQYSGHGQHQNYAHHQNYARQENPEWKKFAISALICGIVAMMLPIPILDLIAGIAAIILIVKSSQLGGNGALHITALVLAIVGTIFALSFTATMLFIVPLAGGIFEMLMML